MKKKLYINPWLAPALCVLCLGMLLVNLLMPDQNFSDAENRVLAHFPGLSLSGMSDGKNQQEIDTWYADQFTGRQLDFHANYLIRKLAGQRSINDVFLGKGALLGQSSSVNEAVVEGNVKAINTFASYTGLPVGVLVAPNAGTIQTDRLPLFAPMNSQNPVLDTIYSSLDDSIKKADVRSNFLDNRNSYLYYRTDHHWTSLGAGLAWQVYAVASGLDGDISAWDTMQVSNSFTGTLAGKTGSTGLEDDIYIAVAPENPDYIVTWADGSKTTSIYNQKALQERDQYQLFLGSNQSVVQIDTTVDNQSHLLVIKDSYANSMIQYMLPYYQSITIVDPRYYYENLGTLLNLYNISEVLFLFSTDTFVSDGSLQSVLASAQTDLAHNQSSSFEDQEEEPSQEEEEAQETPDSDESFQETQ